MMYWISRVCGVAIAIGVWVFGTPHPARAQVELGCTTPGENIAGIRESLAALEQSAENPSLNFSYNVTQSLNSLVQSNKDIQDFRCQDTLANIQSLLSLARVNERAIRVNSSLVLANVVDNTTLCAVLNELSDPSLESNTRYNLWQVVKVVAKYARPENKIWIVQTVRRNEEILSGMPDFGKTLSLMDEVEEVVAFNNVTRSLKQDYEAQRDECLRLPNIADIPLPADLQ